VAMTETLISSLAILECVDKFCYLEDLIGAGGGAEEALRARVLCLHGQSSVLTSSGAPLEVKGKVYRPVFEVSSDTRLKLGL